VNSSKHVLFHLFIQFCGEESCHLNGSWRIWLRQVELTVFNAVDNMQIVTSRLFWRNYTCWGCEVHQTNWSAGTESDGDGHRQSIHLVRITKHKCRPCNNLVNGAQTAKSQLQHTCYKSQYYAYHATVHLGVYQIQHVSPHFSTIRIVTVTAFTKHCIYLITRAHIAI